MCEYKFDKFSGKYQVKMKPPGLKGNIPAYLVNWQIDQIMILLPLL